MDESAALANARYELGMLGIPFTWATGLLFSVVYYLSFGTVSLYPKTIVSLVDIDSRATVLKHSFSDPLKASFDFDAIRANLRSMTVDEFASHYGLEGSLAKHSPRGSQAGRRLRRGRP